MARNRQPDPGQGVMFQLPPEVSAGASEIVFLPSDYDAPATDLAEHYMVIAGVIKDIAAARSNQHGFSKLSNTSKPVKEFASRLEIEPEEAKQVVSKAGKRHYIKGQEKLNRQTEIEHRQIKRHAEVSGAFTSDEVSERAFLPPSVYDVELKYFDDPEKEPKELEAARRKLYRAAKKYSKAA